jgi:DNA gyrase/topoisomerase IV subunit A
MKKQKLPSENFTIRSDSKLLIDEELGDFTEAALKVYGEEVNLNRAVPDYRDGLKPVARRLLYALHSMPKGQLLKTARLIGDTMGRLHPHGSAAILGATATLVVCECPPIAGVGNWGSIIDPPGADRYTNVRMSAYGSTFFHTDYSPLTKLIPNYDQKDKEPLFLPALLPNLLLNGTDGIGLGLTTRIPAFTPASLLPILADLADGVELSDKDIAKRLEFYHRYGGIVEKDKVNLVKTLALCNSTSGSIQWTSPFVADRDKKTITIGDFGPEINPVKLIEEKVKPCAEVANVYSGKGVSYVIQIRKDVNTNDFDKFAVKFKKMVSSSISYNFYVTSSKVDSEGRKQVKFANVTLVALMKMWVKFRINLETASLKNRLEINKKRDAYLALMILASNSLDLILKALKTEDPQSAISKSLKISMEDANSILDLPLRRLTKLNQTSLEDERSKLSGIVKDLNKRLAAPEKEVSNFLRSAKLTLTKNDCSTQWLL